MTFSSPFLLLKVAPKMSQLLLIIPPSSPNVV